MIGDISDGRPKTFVFDLDGVVYVDHMGVPGAGETLTFLERTGHQVLFATNNSSRAVDAVVENIRERTGFDARQMALDFQMEQSSVEAALDPNRVFNKRDLLDPGRDRKKMRPTVGAKQARASRHHQGLRNQPGQQPQFF